jgi:hypothetical protein
VSPDLSTIPDAAWQQARERFSAIAPLLDRIPARKDVELRSKEIGRQRDCRLLRFCGLEQEFEKTQDEFFG